MDIRQIKRHDTYPPLGYLIRDSAGALLPVAGATVTFTMVSREDGTTKVLRADGVVVGVGHIRYAWKAADTNMAGKFKAEFEVVLSSGEKFTVPNDDSLTVQILEDLDDT